MSVPVTISSPGASRSVAQWVAAMPDAKANARTPPSRSASVFSKACRVGLPVRA